MLCVFRVGAFGATFIQGSLVPSEAVIYAARPGLRLWKADINGIVHTTLIFKNSSAREQSLSVNHASAMAADSSQAETETVAVDFPTADFGLLQVYCGGLLASYTTSQLLVVSPEDAKQIMFMYTDMEEGIVDVAMNRDEIFLLRKPSSENARPLIRLAQRPLCPRQFMSPPAAMSTSCIYAEPHRKYIFGRLFINNNNRYIYSRYSVGS